ncbi:UNVERIFIED_CONTAM: hypothetical protein FKN15_052704 [Acipenser sinensis]
MEQLYPVPPAPPLPAPPPPPPPPAALPSHRSSSISYPSTSAAGRKTLKRTPLYQRSMSFDPNMLHSNGHSGYASDTAGGLRETGVIEKLLNSYGFIQCSERQARLFFHCSQYNGNLQELKVGDDVEFEVSSDRRTGKPIAVKLVKIKPEILPEERITGQEVFYLTYAPEDVEGSLPLETGDKVTFFMETNKQWVLSAGHRRQD